MFLLMPVNRQFNAHQRFLLHIRPLAAWTEVCATLSYNNTLYGGSTAYTRFARLMIDMYMVIVVASLPPEITIVVKRCTTMLNTKSQYSDNSMVKRLDLISGENITT